MFGFGPWELVMIGSAILLIMGPAILPRLGGFIGKTVTGLRESAEGFSTNMKEEMSGRSAEPDRLLAERTEKATETTESEEKNPTLV